MFTAVNSSIWRHMPSSLWSGVATLAFKQASRDKQPAHPLGLLPCPAMLRLLTSFGIVCFSPMPRLTPSVVLVPALVPGWVRQFFLAPQSGAASTVFAASEPLAHGNRGCCEEANTSRRMRYVASHAYAACSIRF